MNRDKEIFFKDHAMSFVECRLSRSSQSVFKPHMHPSFSIGAVESGEVHYQVGDKTSTLTPGSLAIINPETLHSCNTPPGTERSYSMLYLDPAWCFRVQQSLWNLEGRTSAIHFSTIRIDNQHLYDQHRHLVQILITKNVHLQEKEQLLLDFVTAVFHVACSHHSGREQHDEDISLLKELLRKDLDKDYTLDSLAHILSANPYTLLRRFKSSTGLTPHAYRMNFRIDRARQLLQQGTDIAETALLCGFFDQSHLHRHFKAMTTVTPQEYRVNFVQES